MGDNIRHERSTVIDKIGAINAKVSEYQTSMENGYASLAATVSKSSCEHLDALLMELETEKKAAEEIANFFLQLTAMMESASQSIENVETSYSTQKVD